MRLGNIMRGSQLAGLWLVLKGERPKYPNLCVLSGEFLTEIRLRADKSQREEDGLERGGSCHWLVAAYLTETGRVRGGLCR